MAAGHQQIWPWIERSERHKDKFRQLQSVSEARLERINGYIMCHEEDFKIARPTRDGTCVYVGLRKEDGKEVAIKCMLTQNCEQLAENESKIYNMIKMEKSPHVVRYLDFLRGNIFTYIVLELCEFSLVEYVNRARDGLIHFEPQRIIKEILTGLEILHKRGHRENEMILHRDLKPDNVLVDVENNIRLADFGVSKRVVQERSTVHTSGKGNVEWQAAESISMEDENRDVVYTRRSDIQVAGMLAFYVLTKGKHPFGDISYERPMNIRAGTPDMLTDPVEKDFVSWLIANNIEDRPFADEALTHPYLKSIEQQFHFLAVMGQQSEVKENKDCEVVNELNSFRNYYPNGWKAKIPNEIVEGMTIRRNQYNNDITHLLRFLRNIKEHIKDRRTPVNVQQLVGEPATYFLDKDRFSELPMLVHRILRNQAKRVARSGGNGEVWINRPGLKTFFCRQELSL